MSEYEIDKVTLIQTLHTDIRLMLSFYIGEELDLEIPEMHEEIWEEFIILLSDIQNPEMMTGILKKLLAIPREHAKTTLTKLAIILFMRYSRLGFCAYVSNTAPVALNAIRDVRDWFMSQQDAELFGPSRMIKSSETEQLYIMAIQVPGRKEPKTIILKAFGQGTQIRGTIIMSRRPDLLIFDDIESRETVESELQQKRLDAWAMGTALKAMARRGVCVFIGNMIGSTSLLARLSKGKAWNPTVLGSIVKLSTGEITPLWPARWSLDALVADYQSFRANGLGHVWEAEMMNLTAEAILGESLANAWRPSTPMPEDVNAGFICLDPAFGLNSWNDFSAISVHVTTHADQRPFVARTVLKRLSTEQLFDAMLEQSYYWGLGTWVIESVAAQKLLIPLFIAYMNQRMIPASLFTLVPITAGKESKASRIVSMRSSLSSESYGIAIDEEEALVEYEEYTPLSKAKDDRQDSIAYGPIAWAQHGDQIRAHGRYGIFAAIMHGGAVAGAGEYDSRIP